MPEIKCPKCGEIIKLDKSAYDSLLNEVEREEIDKRVINETKNIEAKIKAQYELESNKTKNNQESEINKLKNQISLLQEKLNSSSKDTALAVSKASSELKETLAKKEQDIVKLTSEVNEAKKDAEIAEKSLRESYESQLKLKDEDIKRWKDYRMGDSTKDLGESLEQYCHDMFDEVRADAYPNAYFEKDNESVKEEGDAKGSKGDFIFRDFSSDGIELTSIMFDMKTEKDTTVNKKTNLSHLKKLDEDRTKKGCEYAVLVSTLEADSKLYNRGIVDVSHKFPKMFVIRPQFFLAIIGLIRNMALKSYEYKKQVVVYENEHMDITNFENAVKAVTDKIGADYAKANAIYNDVDDMCQKMIDKINAFRDKFRVAQGHIGAAQNQLDNLSVRKLTKNNPTMKAKFESLEKAKESK